ncbi:MarR family winged helix-turn-helix transcriptional regulator [Planctomicrobium piriforme]|uniref:DNA-binding transcriptional regulator, MarR family n=1 Tax=Planctomicrobium piriforme TaxID=1576369 RepID=A0A1I3IGR8_9PLAN|nr:MarR family winged helix-turn-helix transcriptional regulator [Planctomicrobium piriforme]SFI47027.1 DNA-binding transcriptional regulator, MarR family [Planctomicrobium piriforme]
MVKHPPVSNLEDHVGYWLRFVSNHVSYAFTEKVEAHGVTVAEWVLLREMLQLGPVNPSQLAAELGMTRGAISKLIERLCSKSLAERTSPASDRRYQVVELTAAGRKLVPVLARLADENDREFFGHLAVNQRRELLAFLQDLVERHKWIDVPVS